MANTEQPSISEASSSSWGMVLWKNVRVRMMYHMLVALGRMTAHSVFTSPRFRQTTYRGIMPPEKNIVTENTNTMNLRPGRDLTVSA